MLTPISIILISCLLWWWYDYLMAGGAGGWFSEEDMVYQKGSALIDEAVSRSFVHTEREQRQLLCTLLDYYPRLSEYMEKREWEMTSDEVVRAIDKSNRLIVAGKVEWQELKLEDEIYLKRIT